MAMVSGKAGPGRDLTEEVGARVELSPLFDPQDHIK